MFQPRCFKAITQRGWCSCGLPNYSWLWAGVYSASINHMYQCEWKQVKATRLVLHVNYSDTHRPTSAPHFFPSMHPLPYNSHSLPPSLMLTSSFYKSPTYTLELQLRVTQVCLVWIQHLSLQVSASCADAYTVRFPKIEERHDWFRIVKFLLAARNVFLIEGGASS